MKIFNTLSRRKEEFTAGDTVSMYVCGVTTYDECHIGHAMSYIVFDAIRRYLEFKGYKVNYVQNFTDIDDKIINRAQALNVPPPELSAKYIAEYFHDMDALNIKRASSYPRATEEIPEIIRIIEALIEKDHAYESAGSVYFRVKTFAGYGKLSGQNTDDMLSRAAHTTDEEKEHSLDFALWKNAKPGEPFWPSPWGNGRPGWHIECSAMSLKYLGSAVDIHGGGQDLIFPHHENELAQSESYTGVAPFARYWLHNGLLQMGKEKMSKSLGNLITVKQALSSYSADAIRLFILSSLYRNPLTYSREAFEAAARGAERLQQAAKEAPEAVGSPALNSEPFRNKFVDAMDDDFNTAQATAVLFDLAREINRARTEGAGVSGALQQLRELASVLGFTLKEEPKSERSAQDVMRIAEEISQELKAFAEASQIQGGEATRATIQAGKDGTIDDLVRWRNELRKARRWQEADIIRKKLASASIVLEDTPKGTIWKSFR